MDPVACCHVNGLRLATSVTPSTVPTLPPPDAKNSYPTRNIPMLNVARFFGKSPAWTYAPDPSHLVWLSHEFEPGVVLRCSGRWQAHRFLRVSFQYHALPLKVYGFH